MKKLGLDDYIACVFLFMTVITVIANVFMRYFFNSPLKSAEEIATICFIYTIFIGGAAAYRRKMHMGIDILVYLFPEKIQNKLTICINIIVSFIMGIIFYLSIIFTINARLKPTPVLGISSVYENASLIFGFGLIFIYSINNLFKAFKKGEKDV